jgi:hypothetical protein
VSLNGGAFFSIGIRLVFLRQVPFIAAPAWATSRDLRSAEFTANIDENTVKTR